MDKIFEVKGQLSQLYTKYSRYIDLGFKFLLALLTMTFINKNIGFSSLLANPVITIVLSLICTLLPMVMTMVFASVIVLVHIYTVSLGMLIVSVAIFIVMYAIYLRYAPKRTVVLLLVLVAYMFNVPMVIPVVFGLIGNPVCIVPISLGVVFYYMISYVKNYATLIGTVAETGIIEQITAYTQQLFSNRAMLTTVVSFGLVLLIVYYLKRLEVDHSWKIASVAGVLCNLIIMVFSGAILDVEVNYLMLIVGSIFTLIIAIIVEFFMFSVDYSRTEHLQFEDDEYYYYIKAVPKVSVAAAEKTIKRIHVRQEKNSKQDDSDIEKIIDEELKR